ncbi:MAG: hypothetical protein PHU04_04790 [Candidatus Peribacteraceae bacterium]|nr:hypothetical protein [Candidatus Peribacteraceae bacterium]
MYKAERPYDPRIREVRRQVRQTEGELVEVGEYLASLPGRQRADAIAAMHKVFDAGVTLGEILQTPVSPPIRNEQVMLGPDLRAHLREVEVVQGEIGQLRNVTQQIFHERTARHLRSTMRGHEMA